MVVLSIWDHIEPVALSNKLGLYISNFKGSCHEGWMPYLEEQLLIGRQVLQLKSQNDARKIDEKINSIYDLTVDDDGNWAKRIVEKMVFMELDESAESSILGGWDTNCFIVRSCEKDYAEKIIGFMESFADPFERGCLPNKVPMCIFSPTHDQINYAQMILWGGKKKDDHIKSLEMWGKYFDEFLNSKNDYLLLDYLVNALHFDNAQDEYHILKSYSLCQLFLEKEREAELDEKLPYFIHYYPNEEMNRECAVYLRKIRNKLAHGDFESLDALLEKYANEFMDDTFWYDYFEFSRRNWTVGQICMVLNYALRSIIEVLFTNRATLQRIKESK